MWKVIQYIRGTATLTILGASPEMALNRLAQETIGFWDLTMLDSFTYEITLLRKDYPRAMTAIQHAQCEGKLKKLSGFKQTFRGLGKRPGIWVALLAAVILPTVLSQFVWTIDVSGNETIPTQKVLQQLEEVGVYIGAYGPTIKSQDIKNQMLNRIPELQWIAVNRSGGKVQILLKERQLRPDIIDQKQICNIVAGKTGLVTKVEVYSGTVQCQVGQTVLQGQLLVSGYNQTDVNLQTSHAQAEIYARTWRKYHVLVPSQETVKQYTGQEERRYALEIGKKRINFSTKSGILSGSYDKIVSRQYLTLPGGIQFPICLVTEQYLAYETKVKEVDTETAEKTALAAVNLQAKNQMVAGQVLQTSINSKAEGDMIAVELVLECEEMIARSQEADMFSGDGPKTQKEKDTP